MLNLEQLLGRMKDDAGIEKTASETPATKPAVSDELASILEKRASVDLTKQASSQGAELARQLLQKVANEIQEGNAEMAATAAKAVPTETAGSVEQVLQSTVDQGIQQGATSDDRVDPVLDKTASQVEATNPQGNDMTDSELAKGILEKIAQEFSPAVTTAAAPAAGADEGATANRIQQGNQTMAAQADATVMGVQPGGDGTVNGLFQAIVARAVAQGGASDNLIMDGAAVPRDITPDTPASAGVAVEKTASEDIEKAAAVSELCRAGMDFGTAVDLVKSAEAALAQDAQDHEKMACFAALTENGVSFDDAIALIKQAEEDLAQAAK